MIPECELSGQTREMLFSEYAMAQTGRAGPSGEFYGGRNVNHWTMTDARNGKQPQTGRILLNERNAPRGTYSSLSFQPGMSGGASSSSRLHLTKRARAATSVDATRYDRRAIGFNPDDQPYSEGVQAEMIYTARERGDIPLSAARMYAGRGEVEFFQHGMGRDERQRPHMPVKPTQGDLQRMKNGK